VHIASAEAERKRSPVALPSNAGALSRWLIAATDSRELAWAMVDALHDRQARGSTAMPEHLARPDGWKHYDGIYSNPRQKWQREREKALRRRQSRPMSMRAGGEIRLVVPARTLAAIGRRGVLNQHQTGRTEAAARKPARRAFLEDARIGVGIEPEYDGRRNNPAHVLRPKSAILDVSGIPGLRSMQLDAGLFYGGDHPAVLVLKEQVMDRATWSPGDSYDNASRASHSFDHLFYEVMEPSQYFEAQIWGELDLRDVAEIWIAPDTPRRILAQSEALGLPLYHYVPKQKGWKQAIRRGRRISSGDPAIQKALAAPPVGTWDEFYAASGLYAAPPRAVKPVARRARPRKPPTATALRSRARRAR
jgi:hypothetical protein